MDLDTFASTATIIELEKEYDDLAEPILLPIDWFTVEIFKLEVKANKTWKEAIDEAGHSLEAKEVDGAGNNLVLMLKTTDCSEEYKGRMLFKYLPIPNPTDKGKFDMEGRPLVDSKANNLYVWAKGFNVPISGSKISWSTGLKAKVFIHQEKNFNGILANTLKFEEPMAIAELVEPSII